MSTSVVLSPHFESFVQQQLDTGRFNNVSEVIRAGLRLLEEQQQQFATRTLELKAALAEGMHSGQPQLAEDVFDAIEAQVRELAKSRG
ncbi:type II toxin-antitoxin system ParD family antitoxin [Pseudomonas sp. 18175]|uniref:type II toxin-antitoxin system ParD family antitoxin n=1 Tax=Pseudomonas sp. 18175 TaxID=3390056 RepID=UPI003D1BFCD1